MRKKLGIALGSGASRGWAHIGVLNALDEAGISVDFISGTSIGSVVGAVYSLGDLEKFEKFARSLDWKKIVSYLDVIIPGSGFIRGKKLFRILSKYYENILLEDLPIPFCAVAADVLTGDEMRFDSGKVMDAVRASVAIPGVFTPFKYGDRVLVDGGIVNPVPVNIVRKMGADVVIAVDLNNCIVEGNTNGKERVGLRTNPGSDEDTDRNKRIPEMLEEKYKEISGAIRTKFDNILSKEHIPNILEIIDNSAHIMQRSITKNAFQTDPPDIVIEPRLGDFRLFDFDRADEAIEEGYRLMKRETGKIKELLL